ncbi:hypothetical protein SISNIDRAFT_410013 [Sistotremastrum niveocremeum HHB9708]|uniref:Uncharacterized protein n=1 Tax=Sistotremastrum niveocremeum HHB9708 TaxID=1314777 RepID=A0A164VZF9_9AGAM|nr:hypothetical protein SISNIDRAFT_410013 [Sistotremastrum niveocremeum HHB9708]
MDLDEDEDSTSRITSPGESIISSQAFMRGHGTYLEKDQVVSSVAGTIERVNRLVSVKAIRARKGIFCVTYIPEVGDLVVGRVTEVAARRWKVHINARQDSVLMLGSVNLPGGIQRRKLESDELQMRTFFEEGDLLVAEIQQIMGDGGSSLHTRSLKYGKLRNGMLEIVPSALVRRLKSHFFSLPCGVDIILGLNGFIWIMKHVKDHEQLGEQGFDAEAVYSNQNDDIDQATRGSIARTANIIRVLSKAFVPLTDAILADAYEWFMEQEGSSDVKSILNDEMADQLVAAVTARA